MITDSIEAFAHALPRAGAVAGLDLGTATIGVAVSDGLRRVASPIETIKRKKFGKDAAATSHVQRLFAGQADHRVNVIKPQGIDFVQGFEFAGRVPPAMRQLAEFVQFGRVNVNHRG